MTQILVIIGGTILGLLLYSRRSYSPVMGHLSVPTSIPGGLICLILFFVILLFLPVVVRVAPSHILDVFNGFYRAGSLVFGGGHVVLLLLKAEVVPRGWLRGMLCLGAVFLPSIFLVLGVLPFWEALRKKPVAQAALQGTNAVVVGILLAALYDPVWLAGINTRVDFIVGLGAFGLLLFWKVPSWLVVTLAAAAGIVLG